MVKQVIKTEVGHQVEEAVMRGEFMGLLWRGELAWSAFNSWPFGWVDQEEDARLMALVDIHRDYLDADDFRIRFANDDAECNWYRNGLPRAISGIQVRRIMHDLQHIMRTSCNTHVTPFVDI